ncbi:MAG: hypothetical protein GTN65_02775, partial [Armatimonadetes bacterium]|nr:hypothetical protein [Armatimonadota bacterium]NIO96030.1 hypothetical protein [Armatimonadota bacterium]
MYSEPEGAQADLQEESVPPIAPETQQPEIEEAAVEDMPGWVSETPAERQEAAAEAPETADEELDLAPAELPGWLKAMRP